MPTHPSNAGGLLVPVGPRTIQRESAGPSGARSMPTHPSIAGGLLVPVGPSTNRRPPMAYLSRRERMRLLRG